METFSEPITRIYERMKNIRYKFSKALIAIFAIGALSQSCGLIPIAEDVFSRLPTPLILYVSTTGNDANDCQSEATACLTLRAAVDKATVSSTITGNTTGLSNDGILFVEFVTLEQNTRALYNRSYAYVDNGTFDNNNDGDYTITNSGAMSIDHSTISKLSWITMLKKVDNFRTAHSHLKLMKLHLIRSNGLDSTVMWRSHNSESTEG